MEICDILITDYSSIYFDWILSNKPVIFYTPDYDDYSEKQGLYFDFPCLPAKDLNMLKAYIENINDYWDSVKYKISSDNLNINSNGKIFSKDILNILLFEFIFKLSELILYYYKKEFSCILIIVK